MNQASAQNEYQGLYNAFGVIIPSPMVAEVLENKHGIDNPVIDLDTGSTTTVTPSGTNGIIVPTLGAIDDSNVTFAFAEEPEVVVVNGNTYRLGHGWAWDGANVILDAPVGTGGDLFGLGTATVLAVVVPTGTVDDSNVTFLFPSTPMLVVINGKTNRTGHGWSGTATVTLDYPPGTGGDVFQIL